MTSLFFSPKGTTKRVAQAVTEPMGRGLERDLLLKPLTETLHIAADEPVLVALPVYAGRIPALCRTMLSHLRGDGTPAIAVVVYGNRHYDDALLELVDLLEENGFCVVAAGAFVAQHSIFPNVAKGRPDAEDGAALEAFSSRCKETLEGFASAHHARLTVPGNPDYRQQEPHGIPLKPIGNQNCIKCRACVSRCPTKSIPADDPKQTQADTCISCGACIYICPVEARGYNGPAYAASEVSFGVRCGAYRRPEVFF